jgi:hypothetical protein
MPRMLVIQALLLTLIHRSAWKCNSANFAMKLSENPHDRANLLAIRRLIAT